MIAGHSAQSPVGNEDLEKSPSHIADATAASAAREGRRLEPRPLSQDRECSQHGSYGLEVIQRTSAPVLSAVERPAVKAAEDNTDAATISEVA